MPRASLFFQIHKDGKNVNDQVTYETLSQARRALAGSPVGAEVVEIDIFDKVIRRHPKEEPLPEKHRSKSLKPTTLERGKWTRDQKLVLLGVIIAVLAIVAAFFVPEVRRKLGLEKPAATPSSPQVTQRVQTAAPPESPAPVAPKQKTERHPNATVQQNKGNGSNSSIGSVVQQGTNNILQQGNGNQATIVGVVPPPPRKLSKEQLDGLISAVSGQPMKVLVLYGQRDEEAYQLAKQISDALVVAGWTLIQPPTEAMIAREGGGPLYGIEVRWHGARVPAGTQVHFDSSTPWGALSIQLQHFLPEEFYVNPGEGAESGSITLLVYANPKAKPIA